MNQYRFYIKLKDTNENIITTIQGKNIPEATTNFFKSKVYKDSIENERFLIVNVVKL